jgi:hypothetical protein
VSIAQELPENQDPGVAFILDEITGLASPLPGGPLDDEASDDEKPQRGNKRRGGRRSSKPAESETAKSVDEVTPSDLAALAELGTQKD